MLFVGQGIFPGVTFRSRVMNLCAWLIKNHRGLQITAASYDYQILVIIPRQAVYAFNRISF